MTTPTPLRVTSTAVAAAPAAVIRRARGNVGGCGVPHGAAALASPMGRGVVSLRDGRPVLVSDDNAHDLHLPHDPIATRAVQWRLVPQHTSRASRGFIGRRCGLWGSRAASAASVISTDSVVSTASIVAWRMLLSVTLSTAEFPRRPGEEEDGNDYPKPPPHDDHLAFEVRRVGPAPLGTSEVWCGLVIRLAVGEGSSTLGSWATLWCANLVRCRRHWNKAPLRHPRRGGIGHVEPSVTRGSR